jgi:hypothetical protein
LSAAGEISIPFDRGVFSRLTRRARGRDLEMPSHAAPVGRAVDLTGKRLFPSVTRMTWHFEINNRAKSRVSDWRQKDSSRGLFPG